MPKSVSEPYLTTGEVARLLSASERTIRRYEQAGVLPAVRLPSGHRRFRPADVEAVRAAAQR